MNFYAVTFNDYKARCWTFKIDLRISDLDPDLEPKPWLERILENFRKEVREIFRLEPKK